MKNKLLRLIIMTIKLSACGLVLQIFCMGMLMGFDSNAQYKSASETYIDVWGEDKTVGEILKMIENSTDFSFYYIKGEINKKQKISLNISGLNSVADVLLKISKESKLKFRQVNNSISISPISKSELKKGIGRLEVEIASIKITGKITSDADPDGLPGVNVILKGTNIGTVSDVSGDYSIEVPDENSILTFSSVGYVAEEIVVGNRTIISLVLTPDITALEEIVVIGYGSVKKKDLTGAVVSLSEEDMTTGAAITSAAGMLQGRAAGVEVSSGDGTPGGALSIVIRGNTSISNSNEPLYVVDGFPIAAGVTINPADIESIDILKDASAAAIYGSRGSSGVVLITTKRGKRGKTSVSYDGFAGVQQLNNTVDFLGWNDYAANRNAIYADGVNDGFPWYDATDLALPNDTDWIEEGTRDATIQSHTISATGGDETTRFALSANSFTQEGILHNTDFNRTSVRLNVDRKFGNKANVGVNIYTAQTKSDQVWNRAGFRNGSVMYQLLRVAPGRAAYNDDGSYGNTVFSRDQRPWINPIARMEVPERNNTGFRTYVTLWADYEITKGLVAKVNVGYDNSTNTFATYYPGPYSAWFPDPAASISESKSTSSLVEGTLNYTPSISDEHSLNILAGASNQYFNNFGFSSTGRVFPTDKTSYYNLGSATDQFVGSWRSDSRIISFFGRANYSYRDKYLLTATLRADGASQFGENNKWGTFPSASAAWRISEEVFLSGSNFVDNLKVRVAYGITGNNSFSPYTALARVGSTTLFSYDGQGSGSGLTVSGRFAPNPDLRWETSKMINIGLDFGFWGSRLFGSAEVYSTNTSDLIIDKDISQASTGFSVIRANVGEINNQGIELTLGGNIIDGDFKWTASANLSKNVNEITKLDGDAPITLWIERRPSGAGREQPFRQMIEGGEMGNIFGYTYAGVIGEGETYDPQPNSVVGNAKYVDINEDGIINADDRSNIGNATPDFIWGFNNRFSYKGLSLDVFFQGVQGNDVLNIRGVMIDELSSNRAGERYSSTLNPTGTRPGVDYFYGEYGSYVNTEFVEDASYVRLKNVVLTYKFNTSNLSWLGNVEIYVQGQNLLTFTNYSGFDPEVSFNYSGSSRAVGRGVDDNGFPNYKTYTAGLRISF